MTTRTWLAGMALPALIALSGHEGTIEGDAKSAVTMADALLAELEKPPQPAEKAPKRQS